MGGVLLAGGVYTDGRGRARRRAELTSVKLLCACIIALIPIAQSLTRGLPAPVFSVCDDRCVQGAGATTISVR
jgi:hypothetical protein